MIQSQLLIGPEFMGEASGISALAWGTTFIFFTPLRFAVTLLLEFSILLAEAALEVDDSEEHELSTDALFLITGSGILGAGFFGFFGTSVFRFGSSEALTLFPVGPRIARCSETGLASD